MFRTSSLLAAAALALAALSAPVPSLAWATAADQSTIATSQNMLQVGKDEVANIEVAAGVSREDIISYPNAGYIAVRFDAFHLPEGDEVVVRSPDFSVAYAYTNKGRADAGAFYATFIPGDTAIVQYIASGKSLERIHASNATTSYGYKIPAFARGFTPRSTLSVCGADQTVPAKCYAAGTTLGASLPLAYERSQAVARLLINGTGLCTGWLAGSEGHLITNRHCIKEAALADKIDIEFGAESASCSDECRTQLGCKGALVATTSTFVTNSQTYDYALVKLPVGADVQKYGFLQLRAKGPVLRERIYIPQHPVGYAKRIAGVVENQAPATIEQIGVTLSCGSNQVGYSADTEGGSSGSPLLATSDNLVVALHHCGGCRNQAVDVRDLIADLKRKQIVVKDLIAA